MKGLKVHIFSLRSQAKMYLPYGQLPEPPTYDPIVKPDKSLCELKQVTDDELWKLIEDRYAWCLRVTE